MDCQWADLRMAGGDETLNEGVGLLSDGGDDAYGAHEVPSKIGI